MLIDVNIMKMTAVLVLMMTRMMTDDSINVILQSVINAKYF